MFCSLGIECVSSDLFLSILYFLILLQMVLFLNLTFDCTLLIYKNTILYIDLVSAILLNSFISSTTLFCRF